MPKWIRRMRCWFYYHNGPLVEGLFSVNRYLCTGCDRYFWQLGNSQYIQAIDPDQTPHQHKEPYNG